MKARHRSAPALAGLAIGFAIMGASTEGAAQGMNARVDPNAPRIMVPALRGSEKNVGVQAADAIRSRLNQDVPYKQLYVLPKSDIVAMLEASGYNPNEPLPPNDAKELAKLLRADEYLEGSVTRGASGFRIESRLVLARDNALSQPLPPVEGARLDVASKSLSTEIQNARKQLESERKCVALAREGKFKEAVDAAQAGVAAYPQAVLARNCIMQAYVRLQYPTDSILRVAQEILTIHPRFRPALQLAGRAYKEKGDTSRMVTTYGELLAANPGDANTVEFVVTEIASSGRAMDAIPIIDKAVAENPGDTKLLDLQFRLKYFAKDYKGAIAAGDEVAKLDTAMMDTTYFQRMAAAYVADSQPQKASEQMARATQKFAQHAPSWMYYAQMLRQAGQTQQAATAVKRALSIDANVEGGLATLVQLQMDANQADSAMVTIRSAGFAQAARQCVTTAADSTKAEWQQGCKKSYANTVLLSQLAAAQGNKLYKVGVASKKPEDFRAALPWLRLADSVATNNSAQLLIAATYVQSAQPILQAAQAGKSCDLAKEVNTNLVDAQLLIPKAASDNKQLAGQLMGAAQQLLPYSEQMMKAYCK